MAAMHNILGATRGAVSLDYYPAYSCRSAAWWLVDKAHVVLRRQSWIALAIVASHAMAIFGRRAKQQNVG